MPSVEQLLKVHAADPADTFVLYALAQEHAKLGKHADAISWYDRCLAADPNYFYAYFHKARSQQALNQLDAAIATLRTGLDLARRGGDGKAAGEIAAFLDELQ